SNDTVTVSENTIVTIPFSFLLANDYDPDGDPLAVVQVSTNSTHNGRIITTTTNLTFTPPTNYVGTDTLFYVITDGLGAFSTGTVFVVLTPPQFGILQGTHIFTTHMC